ncbi:MAG: amidase [Pseudomonadales bacterium]|nr:amidase [Pseudomonadales bacterium]
MKLSYGLGALLVLLLSSCSEPEPIPDHRASGWFAKTLPEITAALDAGEITSEELVQGYLDRIESIDRHGPNLRAVLSLNPEAINESRALDRLRKQSQVLGPLHGVPILLKDNIESKEPLPTTAGSFALEHNVTNRDAPLVAGLREQGAIILGKANLSEWANFRSQASMSGWSGMGGQVKNPHMLDRNPCGSSSGSAAAVAASLAAGAIGTETNGSVICPATVNGIVGFKPTVGLVAQDLIVPISPTQDTAGPMTKTVVGAAMLLGAMDNGDADYVAGLDTEFFRGKRIGVARFSVGQDTSIQPIFDAALLVLESVGAELVEIESRYEMPANFRDLTFVVLAYEFKQSINQYLANTPPEVGSRSLADLIQFNRAHSRELNLFDQSIFEVAAAKGALTDEAYQEARAITYSATREQGIDWYLKEYEVDLLVAPSGVPAPRRDPINGDVWPPFVGIGWMAAVAGYPHATVPMGTVDKLPIGLSFIGSANEDTVVLAGAFAYEQASLQRVDPEFLSSAAELTHISDALEAP